MSRSTYRYRRPGRPSRGGALSDASVTSAVGRVVGTEDSTPLQFSVALAPEQYLQLDDVVVTVRPVPGIGPVLTAGVVTEVRARHEGATFGSDVFLIADGVLPAQVQEIAEVTTTRVEPECYVPPTPGLDREAGDRRGAGAGAVLRPDGPQGAGRARPRRRTRSTSTSSSSTARAAGTSRSAASPASRRRPASRSSCSTRSSAAACSAGGRCNAKALVFSVKGEDLLFLDHANTKLDEDLMSAYATVGLPAGPFSSAGFFAPPTPDDLSGRPYVTGRTSGVSAFWWTLAEFCAEELLPYVFADAEDERNQYTMVIHQVAARLRREATPVGDGGSGHRRPGAAHLRRPDRVRLGPAHRRGRAPRLGGPGHRHRHDQRVPAAAALEPAAAALDRPRRPHRLPGPPGQHRRPPGHGRRPAQPPRARAAVRRGRRAGGRDPQEGGRRAGRAALHHDRRAEQVRPARGLEPDQGGAARHRRTRPVARASS